MIHGKEKIPRDSADGTMPDEEKNFFVALNKLADDSNNYNAKKTVTRQASTLLTPGVNFINFL